MEVPGPPGAGPHPRRETPQGDDHGAAWEAALVRTRVAELRTQWTRVGADIATRLRPGCDDAALDAAEAALGAPLPPGARAWFAAIDGVEPVRTRFRTSAPSVGPGGWVPMSLAAAVRRVQERTPRDFDQHLPLFVRDEQFLAVRLDCARSVVDQLILDDPTEDFSRGWSVDLPLLLGAWATSLIATVVWLPDSHDWVVDPFSARALPHGHLLD